MAFDLSSPAAALAFDMALRNQQVIDNAGQYDADARRKVTQSLSVGYDPFEPFAPIYQEYMGPAQAQRIAQAQAFNKYLVGLPELLAKAAKEGSSGSGASASASGQQLSGYTSAQDRLRQLTESLMTKHGSSTATRQPAATQQETFIPRTPVRGQAVTSRAIS